MGLFGFGKKKNNAQNNERKPVAPPEKNLPVGIFKEMLRRMLPFA